MVVRLGVRTVTHCQLTFFVYIKLRERSLFFRHNEAAFEPVLSGEAMLFCALFLSFLCKIYIICIVTVAQLRVLIKV